VILGVLRQITHGDSLLDLRGKLMGELMLKNLDLVEKFFLNMLGHPLSRAGSGAALSAKDERTYILSFIIRGGWTGLPASRFRPPQQRMRGSKGEE
jgi:hypothetical protein